MGKFLAAAFLCTAPHTWSPKPGLLKISLSKRSPLDQPDASKTLAFEVLI